MSPKDSSASRLLCAGKASQATETVLGAVSCHSVLRQSRLLGTKFGNLDTCVGISIYGNGSGGHVGIGECQPRAFYVSFWSLPSPWPTMEALYQPRRTTQQSLGLGTPVGTLSSFPQGSRHVLSGQSLAGRVSSSHSGRCCINGTDETQTRHRRDTCCEAFCQNHEAEIPCLAEFADSTESVPSLVSPVQSLAKLWNCIDVDPSILESILTQSLYR